MAQHGSTNLDDLDMKIVDQYCNDARQSFRQIAKKVGAATSTVQERVRKLEKYGIIKGYSGIIDYEKLGYGLTCVTEVNVFRGKVLQAEAAISKLHGVVSVYDVSGSTDIIVIARFKTRNDLNVFVKKLLALPYVERSNTHLVLDKITYNPRP